MSDVLTWHRELIVARAQRTASSPGGITVRHAAYPAAHDHNAALAWLPVDPGELLAATDTGLAGLDHHRIEAIGADAVADLSDPLAAAGYAREDEIVMVAASEPDADRRPGAVEEMTLRERIAVGVAEGAARQPTWAPAVHQQLGHRIATAVAAAQCRFLAVRVDGQVVAHADVFERRGVAQVEEIVTSPLHQGRGYASALVIEALHTAPTMFLVADARDWPQQLYRRLGFRPAGQRAVFTR